ncbi:MAG: hypothetical protein PHS60_15860, partial [Zavarzinia sp.]|nr:hypothetical protein [Zavarzinia sp.]
LETRSVETRPTPKKPQDMLLPGETLRSRWADPDHPHAPGREAAAPAAVPSRPARPARPATTGGPPPPPPLTASASRAPTPAATPATRPRRGESATKIRLGGECSGQYYLDGIAVDTMGRPCSVF